MPVSKANKIMLFFFLNLLSMSKSPKKVSNKIHQKIVNIDNILFSYMSLKLSDSNQTMNKQIFIFGLNIILVQTRKIESQ